MRGGHACLLDLRGKFLSVSSQNIILAVGFFFLFTFDLYYVKMVSFYSCFAECFYCEEMLNFVKCFFSIHWDYLVFFPFHSVNAVYCIDQFLYVRPSLHCRNKYHLIMMCSIFTMLLIPVCYCFVEEFCIGIDKRYWAVVFFSCSVMLAS